ncbi:putative arabinose efflux permease, MFS family [Prauserella aidingensis]|uniref:MFS transporter n=1 Tax=Prauserella aidingensis TaxID=387890 RepID=UPI0020A3C5CB|nr:MFS transporter [Prauserella aidingensis]MCP2254881.1 putative arabinose efflux permease, MFS family [Prauserella aidingensis]MCP2255616.1 putative arabinose efflux permease, MFS family [Prauserella aidingensis]
MGVTGNGTQRLGAPYRWLWTSTAFSGLADGLFRVGLPLVAATMTRSPTLIAGLTFAVTLPWLLLALPVGAFVDRLDRRRIMLAANLTRAGCAAVLAGLLSTDTTAIWLLYAIAFGVGAAGVYYEIAAQSIVPRLVHGDVLARANGRLFGIQLTTDEFVGPPLAGALVAAGATAAVGAPGALWAVGVAALPLVRGRFRVGSPASPQATARRSSPLRRDIAEGVRFLWRQPLLLRFTAMNGLFNLATSATFAIFVLQALGPMSLSGTAYGALLAAIAAGSLLGSVLAERVERLLGRTRTLWVSYSATVLIVAAPALTTNAYAIGAAFFLGGAGMLVANVVTVSLRQRITPDRLLGRVTSAHRLVAWGTKPLGAALGGVVGELFGLRSVFAVMTAVALVLLTALLGVDDRRLDNAVRTTDR